MQLEIIAIDKIVEKNLLGVPGWFLFFFWDGAAATAGAADEDGGKECCCFIGFGSSSLNPNSDAEEDDAAISVISIQLVEKKKTPDVMSEIQWRVQSECVLYIQLPF
ncbi:unnamed protein product [Trifolium pratense]|uniref:Uncharacterized protein n=1 Tax=Trifolium pratense TaxID=57577 RepID=A0ACB0IFR7_TRIPR|nr:unnamed protein product [Trifolium pratense]